MLEQVLPQVSSVARFFIDFILHSDQHLRELVTAYGGWTYGILFGIVFCETGLVVTPILPGDSLLFAAGALAGLGLLDLPTVCLLLVAAAILGDTVNYWFARLFGQRVLETQRIALIKPQHLAKAQAFYATHGPKTIILARFVPIVRTFAPFVAGIGRMHYGRFMRFNILGGVAWVGLCTLAGYFFGSVPVVQRNFTFVALGIVFVSLLPMGLELLRARRKAEPKDEPASL